MTVQNISARADAESFAKYGYSEENLAKAGEVTQVNRLRVLCEHESCDRTTDFESFQEMRQSDWQPEYDACARLTDGTILYEGRCPEHPVELEGAER